MQFVVNGKTVSADELKEIAKKQVKKTPTAAFVRKVDSRQDATLSYGWVVSGYSPGRWSARVNDYDVAKEEHRKAPFKVKSPALLRTSKKSG